MRSAIERWLSHVCRFTAVFRSFKERLNGIMGSHVSVLANDHLCNAAPTVDSFLVLLTKLILFAGVSHVADLCVSAVRKT